MDPVLPQRPAVRGERAQREAPGRRRPVEDPRGRRCEGHSGQREGGQLRFDEAARDLLTDYRVNGKKSIDHVERRIDKALAPWFGMRRMAEMTSADVSVYVDRRQAAGAANGTINRELSALKRMFTLAVRAGKLMQRPHIPMLQEDNTRKGFFERAQFEAVRAKLPATLQPIATFAYYTGWRTKSEILPLQWHQVDRDAGVIRLEPGTTKNREGRLFKYAELDDLRVAVDALWAVHEALEQKGTISPYILVRVAKKTGKVRQIRNFRRAWLAACEAAGCPGRIPHDFRRTGSAQSDTRWRDGNGGDEDHRPQDAQRLRSLRHHQRGRSRRRVAEAAGAGRDNRRDKNAIRDADALRKLLGKTSGPPGDRTQDTVIKSHVLYH